MMRIASLVLLVVGLVVHVEPVGACSCLEKNPVSSYFEAAKAVFAGYPTSVRLDQRPAGEQGLLASKMISRTVIEFHVEKWWKGGSGATAVVLTGMGGGDCGSDFRVGMPYIVFAVESREGLYTSTCSGNMSFNTAGREIEELNRLANPGEQQK